MNRRYLSSSLLVAVLFCFFASSALAQQRRADGIYVRGRVGASSYAGDRDNNPDNALEQFVEDQIGFPSLGLELGYAIPLGSLRGSLALTYIGAQYQQINRDFPGNAGGRINRPFVADESSRWRHTLGLVAQLGFLPQSTVNPYIRLGAGATAGNVFSVYNAQNPNEDISDWELVFSPIAGIGVDFAVSDRIGIFLGATGIGGFPGDNTDLACGLEECDFDVLGSYGGGLRVTFDSPFTPVQIIALDGPQELTAGESGTFTATVNDVEATPPLSYVWEFGDGATATGLLATHTYTDPGTYEVTFIVANEGSRATQSMTVEVVPPPVPAEIVSISAEPNEPEVGETVEFSSEIRGDEPIECQWDFGDGATADACEATHVYEEEGTYEATLTLQNEFGEDSQSLTVEVQPEIPAICMQVTELNSVYFEYNTSTLTEEAREALQENLDILTQCPNICVRIVGYAAPGERNAEDLAEARAEAVAAFYTDAGVEAERITVVVEGVPAGQTTKKGAGQQFRRVDTIPGQCDMMDMDDMDM